MKEKVCLNLGCGKTDIPNFTNVDLADYPHIHYKNRDIADLSIFKDNSVDYIYCSHALQYKDRVEGLVALREWRRVLKLGGMLRIAVPDFEAIIYLYLKTEDLESKGILGPLYGKMRIKRAIKRFRSKGKGRYKGSHVCPECGMDFILSKSYRLHMGWHKRRFLIYHKTAYDFESLKRMLEFVGFKDVRRYEWRRTLHKDYDDHSQSYIPHLDKENGVLISLNVEATK